jgi:ABC-2 type transport system permease protein
VFRRAASLSNPGEIARVIDADKALLVLGIPADFEDRLASGRSAPLQVILDGRNSSTASVALAQIGAVVNEYNRSRAPADAAGATVSVERRSWYNPNLESRWNVMPALIATLSMIQTLLLAALSVAREREQGTFDQLLVTPLTPVQILIGKALPAMAVGLVQATLILLVIRFWFQIPVHGSVPFLYLGLLIFTGAVVGFGLSISALSVTMQQAMLYTFFVIMPLVLLSGLITPVRNMPAALQVATYANPLRFGMDFVRRVYLEGAGFSQVAFDFVPLLAVAAVTLPLATWLFRNRLT